MRPLRILVLLSLLPCGNLHAQDSEEAQPIFSYGSSCKQLINLTRQELVGIVHPMHSEYFGHFCSPDGIEVCEDYDALLEGAGQLEDNGQGACRLHLGR